ncbi:hypothetical protein WG66_000659 [Moniliophthora roreri]|nr:hypothetical protein WG66_000659 [Moniliophthora roreri]
MSRFASRLAEDHAAVLNPDIDSPFTDVVDVVNRLLPYHIYLNPKEDLETLTLDRKGKSKADLHSENQGLIALRAYYFRDKICARMLQEEAKAGGAFQKGKNADPFKEETVVLGQLALESDRAEMGLLHSEVRAARAELDRLERAKRATSATPRPSYYPQHTQSQPQATAPVTQPAYYRSYPFAYAQAYGATPQVPPPPTTTPYQAGVAIPVQLPVSSLPALHQLGIIPVPASTAPTSGQPAPPAVLRGSNGTMLSLEINVSLLQPNQMSGLAVILNSLMARTSTATSAASPPPSTTVSTSTPTPNASNVANNVSAGT